ncbi:hypothetical protein IL252_15740 [Halomicrobium sp. IBSBa]|uniref:hypothetical protein n=1 Tax=Halomicrobium sp. IBSBa TaxID=2778916 RepID=UPI001AC008C7|nr:hypothetical protein [Halomicrobium sp. IBSBa]MBO4249268.1 hypothetical protein [Halomicrobium sp. IBSBa]
MLLNSRGLCDTTKKWIQYNPDKADDAYRAFISSGLSKAFPENKAYEFHKAFGKGDDYKRVVTDGGSSYEKVSGNLKKINKINEDKLKKPLTISDVEEAYVGTKGTQIVLLNTGKFKDTTKHLETGPGYRHIVAKHAESGAGSFDEIPTTPGEVSGGTKFRDMNSEEIKKVIKITAQKGSVPKPKEDPYKIIYESEELEKYGIDRVRLIRDPDSGVIITAFPESFV